ncbi:MAG TPA: response regulator transcription factor [Saprospiraceae bacterium]|nr:response regulator transcription factor [Saprospiraceae bacterium]HMU06152.1 response regulator transcription factor [Saprospiraceae bacterium]
MRILIVDDHEIVFSGIKLIIQNAGEKYTLFNCYDGNECIELVTKQDFDLLIVDVNLPDTDTLQLVQLLKIRNPKLKILIFSMSPVEMYAKRFLKLGVFGYLSKQSTSEEFLSAVRSILNGKKYISDEVGQLLVDDVIEGKNNDVFSKLTDRELEVLRLFLKGFTGKEIAKMTNLHTSTIGSHKAKIYQKLNVKNLLELKELARLNNFE